MKTTGLRSLGCLAAMVLVVLSVSASHVRETLKLNKGWNAVYLESTPVESDCAAFFAGELASVVRVGAYLPEAYDDTEQYDSEGQVREQKPVSYYVWSRASGEQSTFKALSGGNCYLVYAESACSKTFLGTPCQPHLVWRAASATEGFLNLVAPSVPAGVSVSAATYLGEGPAGSSPSVYKIAGQSAAAPTLLPLGALSKAKLASGQAYAVTATYPDAWPGVIQINGLSAGAIMFGSADTKASFSIANRGTSARTFRLTLCASADERDRPPVLSRSVQESVFDSATWSNVTYGVGWDVSLEGGASKSLTFGLDRTAMASGLAYGSVLQVEDLSGTSMRVRLPVIALPTARTAGESPDAGLWVGAVAFDEVSAFGNAEPLPAAGTMKLTALVHVNRAGRPTLLPRVTCCVVSNGAETALFHELEDVPEAAVSRRRLTGLLLPASAAPVASSSETLRWGEGAAFTYVVDAYAKDNPFRHAWHPDHDGVNALYDGKKDDGTETWSVTNVITFAWKDADGKPFYPKDPDGLSAGVVTWTAVGIAKEPVTARGMFSFQKVLDTEEVW